MSIKKIKILKTISGVVLVLSGIFLFFSFMLGLGPTETLGTIGSCNYQTEIKELKNPQNINISIDTKCTAGGDTRFLIANHGEDLALNAIRGNIPDFGLNPHPLVNATLCLNASGMSNRYGQDSANQVTDSNLCKPIILKPGEHYQFFSIAGPWELTTNKGNITGYSYYRISDTRIFSMFTWVLFPISVIFYIILNKKEKKLNAKGG